METKDPPQDKNFKVKTEYPFAKRFDISLPFCLIDVLHSVSFIASSKWLAWWRRINSILKVQRSKSIRICQQMQRRNSYPVWKIAWKRSHGWRMAAIMLCCKWKTRVWHMYQPDHGDKNLLGAIIAFSSLINAQKFRSVSFVNQCYKFYFSFSSLALCMKDEFPGFTF